MLIVHLGEGQRASVKAFTERREHGSGHLVLRIDTKREHVHKRVCSLDLEDMVSMDLCLPSQLVWVLRTSPGARRHSILAVMHDQQKMPPETCVVDDRARAVDDRDAPRTHFPSAQILESGYNVNGVGEVATSAVHHELVLTPDAERHKSCPDWCGDIRELRLRHQIT